MSAHTKGPWSVDDMGDVVAGEEDIALVCGFEVNGPRGDRDAEADANARLIAAAPCLLKALEAARAKLKAERDGIFYCLTVKGDPATLDPDEAHHVRDFDVIIDLADAAIANAKGEPA